MAANTTQTNGAAGTGTTKEYGLGDGREDPRELMEHIRTRNSIVMSPELFEKIYLSPQNAVKGDLRKTFGNPTPLSLIGFLLALTPLSCELMGWRGAGHYGAAGTATYFFFGGLLMIIGSIFEFFLGNTFPFVVFGSYGAFWLSYGGTLQPFFNAGGAYSSDGTSQWAGLGTPEFANTFAFFLLFMGLLSLIYAICALRTNICFVVVFVSLIVAFGLLAGSFWQNAQGNTVLGARLLVGGGAATFVTSWFGWYIFFVQILASVDFPLELPLGDLSTVIKGAAQRRAARDEHKV